MADERHSTAADLAEYVRDMEHGLRGILAELADCVQQMTGVSDAHGGALTQMSQALGRHADAASVQRVLQLTQASAAGFNERLLQVVARLASMEKQPTLTDLELGIKDNAIAWRAKDDDWHKLIPLEQLRGPRGGSGSKGEKGEPGEMGAKGDIGDQGPKGDVGEDAPWMQVLFSADSVDWHFPVETETDIYMAVSIDGGVNWASTRIRGIQGPNMVNTATATTLNGILKGNGSTVDVAVRDNDYRGPVTPSRMAIMENDFLVTAIGGLAPLAGTAIASGTNNVITGSANHPGICDLKSSASSNSGYGLKTDSGILLLAGGEECEFIFSVVATTGTTVYLGFMDTWAATACTDGVCAKIVGAVLNGTARNNGAETVTGASYTITQGTWYRLKIAVTSSSSATFTLYTCSDGVVVWTQTVTGNIPTATGRETGCGIVATNSGTTAQSLVYMDWMRMAINRPLAR